jgi:hypothetical protein
MLGTWWEPIGNLKGTGWEQMKKIKILPSPPPSNPKLQRKQIKALWVHAEPSHWLHEISIPKTVGHHIWAGLIPLIIYWGYLIIYLLVWFILIRSWVHSQFIYFNFKGAILIDWPLANFLEHWACPHPHRSTLWTASCKIEAKCAPLDFTFLVYLKGSWTLGKLYEIKPKCYWEQLGNNLGTLGG